MSTLYNRNDEVSLIIPSTAQEHRSKTRSNSRRRHTTFDESNDIITSADYTGTSLSEAHECARSGSLKFTGKRRVTLGASATDFTDASVTASRPKIEDKALMDGWLYKTSRQKGSKTRAHGQHRRFRLTTHPWSIATCFKG